MDADEAQARVQVAAHLYRRVVVVLGEALRERGLPTLSAEEKMRLHGRVEPAAWALPADVFEGDGSEEWLESAVEDLRARRLVQEVVEEFLRERPTA